MEFRGNPVRSCKTRAYECERLELCEGDWICRHHGSLLTVHANKGRLVRLLECVRSGRKEEDDGER